jgi:hypothetical protein
LIKHRDNTTLLEKIRLLSNDDMMSHFLEESYSFELLLLLLKYEKFDGIESLYNSIRSYKPKQPAFDRFITRLVSLGLLVKDKSDDKRVISLRLSKIVYDRLQMAHILFRDMSPIVLKSLKEDIDKVL